MTQNNDNIGNKTLINFFKLFISNNLKSDRINFNLSLMLIFKRMEIKNFKKGFVVLKTHIFIIIVSIFYENLRF